MNTYQKQLQSVLQALAMPVIGQLRLYPNEDCKVSRLIQEYDQFEPMFLAERNDCLTDTQEVVLSLLRRDLMLVYGEDYISTDLALRRSAIWRQVRMRARSALLTFGWPLVAAPQFEPAIMY